jgi:hypothetical protein
MKRVPIGIALVAWLIASATAGSAQGQPGAPSNLAMALAGLAERAQQYYDRISSIVCLETVTEQEVKFNLAPTGKPRVTVYELSVTRDPRAKGDREFRVERALQFVNGKRARKNQEPECTDPKTGTPEPLAFLLAKNQRGFKFWSAPAASNGPEGAVALDFVQMPPERIDIKWKGNCFNAEGGGEEGRLWFDPETFDVLQIEARLPKPFPIPVPSMFAFPSLPVWVERSDVTTHFTRVKFEQPDETVLLPESTESVTLFRGVPSLRTVQILSDFRRFLTEGTVHPGPI